MNIIDKFFGKKEIQPKNPEENNFDAKRDPVITLVFNELPILSAEKIQAGLGKIEKLKKKAKITMDDKLNNGEVLIAVVEFEGHKIKLVGFDAPLPAYVVNNTVECSYWKPEDKKILREHKAHIICYYEGENDPCEKYIVLYKLAYCFREAGLLGVINEGAWNCQPARVIDDLLTKDRLISSRQFPLLLIWTNFLKTPTEKGIWIYTKGNHIFGIKDFAYLSEDIEEATEVNEMFNDIFCYIYDNHANVDVGHTLQIDEQTYLKFKNVESDEKYLEGGMGTLVIEKIEASEINKQLKNNLS